MSTALVPLSPAYVGRLAHPVGPAGPGPRGPAGRRPRRTAAEAPRRRPPDARLHEAARSFAALFLEVEAGRRSRAQLEPLMCPVLYATLAPCWVRRGAPGRLAALRGTRTAEDRYDAVALVRRGSRSTVLAIGLQRRGGRWRVVQAARPEDGLLPPPAFPVAAEEPDVFDLVGPLPGGREESRVAVRG